MVVGEEGGRGWRVGDWETGSAVGRRVGGKGKDLPILMASLSVVMPIFFRELITSRVLGCRFGVDSH